MDGLPARDEPSGGAALKANLPAEPSELPACRAEQEAQVQAAECEPGQTRPTSPVKGSLTIRGASCVLSLVHAFSYHQQTNNPLFQAQKLPGSCLQTDTVSLLPYMRMAGLVCQRKCQCVSKCQGALVSAGSQVRYRASTDAPVVLQACMADHSLAVKSGTECNVQQDAGNQVCTTVPSFLGA